MECSSKDYKTTATTTFLSSLCCWRSPFSSHESKCLGKQEAEEEEVDGRARAASHTNTSTSVVTTTTTGYPLTAGEPVLSLSINGVLHEIQNPDPQQTLLDYLRSERISMGTKKNCAEGGCGACTVVKETYDGGNKQWVPCATNACLAPICSLDGVKITTVEGIGSVDNPHAIQKKLADCNGSQCGFCSPGFVMNMYALLKENQAPSAEEIEQRFDGNICRCTGYRPILDAMHACTADIEDLCTSTSNSRTTGASCEMKRDFKCSHARAGCAGMQKCDPRDCCSSQGTVEVKLKEKLKSKALVFYSNDEGFTWTSPTTLLDLIDLMNSNAGDFELVASMTGKGVSKYYDKSVWRGWNETPRLLIDIKRVQELDFVQENPNGLEFGALTVLTRLISVLDNCQSAKQLCAVLSNHVRKIANVQVRSSGTVGGNLSLSWKFSNFPSDLLTIFAAAGAQVTLVDQQSKNESRVAIEDVTSMEGFVLKSVFIPFPSDQSSSVCFQTYKIMLRHANAHAIVNAGFMATKSQQATITKARLFYGGVSGSGLSRAKSVEEYLAGKDSQSSDVLSQALDLLSKEISPPSDDRQCKYKKNAIQNLFYKFFLGMQANLDPALASAAQNFVRPISSGTVDIEGAENKNEFPVSKPIQKVSALSNCTGQTMFTGDLPALQQTLRGAFVTSSEGCCGSFALDYSQAQSCVGFVLYLDAEKLSEANIGNFVSPSEPLFASKGVSYCGQRLALVLADTQKHADQAARQVKVTYNGTGSPLLTIDDAINAKSFYSDQPETYQKGDAASALKNCALHVTGSASCGHQHHFHMETQTARAAVSSDGIKIDVSTQAPGLIADCVSSSLGVSKSSVEVKMKQAGGGYGGKTSKSIPCALASALASHFSGKPCEIRLDLNANLSSLGSRRPHRFDYEVGCDENGKIQAVKGTLYYLQGAYLDRADTGGLNVMYMSLDGAYNIPNWDLSGYECKTNTPGNTFCRGPIFLPGTFIIEQIMDHVAHVSGADPVDVRFSHLYKQGDEALCGQHLVSCTAGKCWDLLLTKSDYQERLSQVEDFNKSNKLQKRGLTLIPSKYVMNGCSNYPSFVEIFEDGTVLIQHSGCEIGQGIHTKAIQVAAYELGLDASLISCSATSSRIAPSTCVTEGSTTSEAICASTILACQELVKRMKPVKDKMPDASWRQLVTACYAQSVDLHSYCTYTDQKESGVLPDGQNNGPSPYVGYGAAAVEVQVDILTGETQILRCDLVQDNGISLNTAIDAGQVQGSFVMGLGYLLTEEFLWDTDGSVSGSVGNNLANGTWEYKPPSSLDIPIEFNVSLLPNSPNSHGVLSSKAVGEPPLILSCGIISAIRRAVSEFRAENNLSGFVELEAPATVARVQLASGMQAGGTPSCFPLI